MARIHWQLSLFALLLGFGLAGCSTGSVPVATHETPSTETVAGGSAPKSEPDLGTGPQPAGGNHADLTLVFSNNIDGEIEPCG